jgi:hypothetical protein
MWGEMGRRIATSIYFLFHFLWRTWCILTIARKQQSIISKHAFRNSVVHIYLHNLFHIISNKYAQKVYANTLSRLGLPTVTPLLQCCRQCIEQSYLRIWNCHYSSQRDRKWIFGWNTFEAKTDPKENLTVPKMNQTRTSNQSQTAFGSGCWIFYYSTFSSDLS